MCGNIYHAYPGNGIVPHRQSQGYDQGRKSYGFLTHSKDRPKKAEKQHYQHDHQVVHPNAAHQGETLQFLGKRKKRTDSVVYGPGGIHHPESSSHAKNKNDDTCLLDKTVIKSGKDLPCLGSGIHRVKRAFNVFSPGKQPGKQGGQQYQYENNNCGNGKTFVHGHLVS